MRSVPLSHRFLDIVLGVPAHRVFLRVTARGEANVPRRGGIIVVANHLSRVDPALICILSPRHIRYMAKVELFRGLSGLFSRLYGTFPVRRLEADLKALRNAEGFLAAGLAVGMFPEGARSPSARLQRAYPGSALIALRSGAPLVPVAVTGTEHVRGPLDWLRRRRVSVTYGEPFVLAKPARLTREAGEAGTHEIMRRIAALLPEAYRGVYGEGTPPPSMAGEAGDGEEAGG